MSNKKLQKILDDILKESKKMQDQAEKGSVEDSIKLLNRAWGMNEAVLKIRGYSTKP